MKTKFTKGEWIADLRGGCCAVYPKYLEKETNGCHQYDERNIFYSSKESKYDKATGCWSMSEEAQANARLIAAAPKLLEALNHALEIMYKCECSKELQEEYANAYMNYSELIKTATE